MIETHFTDRDLIFLVTGLLAGFVSVFLFVRGRIMPALAALIVSGFALRLWMAFIDPFVNIWDEQFHALVAKNMANHFFTPTLVDQPLLPTDPSYWVYTHVWLHKPPMFLWQMALSIKMFGAAEWAFRLPAVLLSTLMIPAAFRMGKLFSGERTGYIAAFLVASSNILINVNSGFLNTDQNDAVFVVYVCFSFWAWMEYMNMPRKRWMILTGIFAGAALLTKWLPGAMVFGAWGIALLADKTMRASLRSWLHLTFAVLICATLAASWFLYAAVQWPAEFNATMLHYSDHLGNDLGHPGAWWYHFDQLAEHNGILFCILTVSGIVLALVQRDKRPMKTGLFFIAVLVFAFYSVVSIRMPFFCLPVLPLLMVFAAHLLSKAEESAVYRRFRGAAIVSGIVFLLLFIINVNYDRIEHYHTSRDPQEFVRKARIHNRSVFKKALGGIPENAVVFNCGAWNAVPCMFYVTCTAADIPPSESQLQAAKEQQRPVYVFDDGKLPAYVIADTSVTILADSLARNGF